MAEPATTPSATQAKLTWAQRAKKAQATSKPPSTTPRTVPSAGIAAANYRSSAASTISTSSAGSTLVSSLKSPTSVSSPTDVHTPASSVVATTRPSSPASQPKALNGDAQNSPARAASALSPQKSPTVNVWAIRKEQMAANQSGATSGTQSAATGSSPSLSSTASPAVSTVPTSTQNDEDDPFVVKHRPHHWNAQWSRPAVPPAVEDKESWPEIGKTVTSPSATVKGGTRASVSEASQGTRDEDSTRASSSTRKGEKPKWIPIPAEELQAAADANMRRQGRNPQARSNFRSSGPHNAGPSSVNSRGPSVPASRISSVPHSRAQSVANSRHQSRAGSVQTSPFVAIKPLPEGEARSQQGDASVDANGTAGKGSINPNAAFGSGRPSVENPPRPYPYEGPPRSFEPVHGYGQPVPAHGYHLSLNAHPFYPTSDPSSQNESPYSSHAPSPYPPIQLGYPSHTHSPSYSAHGASPAFSYPPHALPPNGMPPYPPPLPFFGGQPMPPNGPYAPYPYGAPPVAAHVPHTSIESEILVSHTPRAEDGPQASEAPITQPAAQTKPPAPEESAAVGGYRNITEKEVKPAVVFGSIAPDGTQLSGPLSPQQTGGATSPSVQETEKAFTRFTIGVKPGEARAKVNGVEKENLPVAGEREIIDLTGQEPAANAPKWRFGSTEGEGAQGANGATDGEHPPAAGHVQKASTSESTDTDLEVKDFGYGFGDHSGTGHAVHMSREGLRRREQERQYELERFHYERREREFSEGRGGGPGPEFPGRGRRGGFVDRPFRSRGRGGRGYRGARYERGGGPIPRQPPSPYNISPLPPFQPLIMGEAPPPGGVPYPPPFVAGFESPYGPPPPAPPPAHAVPPIVAQTSQGGIPFPSPITLVSFPLDPTRWWLLGQLEYYLSPQNLATDFFLRQRMNPQGWIHIPLLASFKRVRQLTTDLQVVKEVLALSRIAQAQDEWVRPLSWQQFVLPTQPPPTETQQAPPLVQPTVESATTAPVAAQEPKAASVEAQSSPEANDEEEEEDVEFVLGNESSFTPAAA
ncbi:hypothetical protein EV122DRAFT_259352 [Schizophyllum commune]